MLEQIAWNTFKQTGNIDTFLELIEVRNMQNKLSNGEIYEECKDKGNNISRK